MPPPRPYRFPASHRIKSRTDFRAVFDEGKKQSRGPLVAYAKPNRLTHPRLGIAIPKHVGIAARRNRIKRLLRESFRLMQHDLPAGYDLVIVVRPHEPLILAEYQKLMTSLTV